jgi:hypothetical protein
LDRGGFGRPFLYLVAGLMYHAAKQEGAMPKVRIITDRLPQRGHHLGAEFDEPSTERAEMLVKQGFAVILDEPAPTRRRKGASE